MPLIELDNYFDRIYCINLKSRPDRLAQFKTNYAALGTSNIQIIEAVDGKQTDLKNWPYSPGALGCRLSHLALYKEAVASGFSRILILEDDAVISKTFRKKFTRLINYVNDDWDMIYFGGYHHLKPDRINKDIVKLNNTLSTHSIAINTRCLKKIIDKIESDERWIDSVIAELHPTMKVYGFKTPTSYQNDGFSDIEGTYIKYNYTKVDRFAALVKRVLKKLTGKK